jgi:hypothetical protein
METLVNERFLAKRRTYARWASYIGFGALFGGLFASTRIPTLSYALLLVGLGAASIGSFLANRYLREPRADQLLSRALEGLDKRYTLFSYCLPTDHVVFSHKGFTVIETRAQQGNIAYRNGRWSHRAGARKFMQLFGEPSLGKPEKDLERQIGFVTKWLETAGWNEQVPVNGVIVFTNPNARLSIEGLAYPAVPVTELAQFMRSTLATQTPLSTSQRREIEGKLDALVSAA